jgi:transcriptional regulator with XRE-family HTH domain
LRWWRRARGLTQAELAGASGVERSHLAKIERGEVVEPRPDTLRRLADALGVEVLELLFGEASIEVFGAPEDLAKGPAAPHQDIADTSPRTGDSANHPPTSHPQKTTGRTNR